MELQQIELSESQKEAIDEELILLAGNPDYLQKWDDVKTALKKHNGLYNLYKPRCVT